MVLDELDRKLFVRAENVVKIARSIEDSFLAPLFPLRSSSSRAILSLRREETNEMNRTKIYRVTAKLPCRKFTQGVSRVLYVRGEKKKKELKRREIRLVYIFRGIILKVAALLYFPTSKLCLRWPSSVAY